MPKRSKTVPVQPDAVCNKCGILYGKWYSNYQYIGPFHHVASYSMEDCDVCGTKCPCTEARDFGYLNANWREHLAGKLQKASD